MRRPNKHNSLLAALLLVLLGYSLQLHAQARLSPRLQIGINLLPGVIAANTALRSQLDQEDPRLTIYIVYAADLLQADAASEQLARVDTIRDIPVDIRIVRASDLFKLQPSRHHAVLMIERLVDQRERLIDFCNRHQLLLFSPFKGDVENGVMTGFEVTNKVLPAINMTALTRARINLKAFFLRIAIKYE